MADDGFTAFFQGAYPRIVGQLRLLTGDLASAEDIAQEAFIRAASRWRQLARYDQPEAWVRRTAFRLAIDLLRRARRHRRLLARLGTRTEPDVELYPQDRAVIEALLRLPLPQREVLVLHHCLDLPVEAVAAQTGRELIVWGGLGRDPFRTLADGAAFDPRTGRWALLPPAPEGQWLEGDHGLAVWTGREVLVWGGDTFPDPVGAPGSARLADGVAYDPQRRTWRRLPARTAQPTPSCGDCWAVWTGRELVVGQVEEADAGGGTVAVAYDPAANRWRPLPPSPTLTGGNGHLPVRGGHRLAADGSRHRPGRHDHPRRPL